jgi:hypothetical protein
MYNRLNTAYKTRIRKATLAIGHADLTDADSQQAFDFSAALPSDAYVIGRYIAVTEAFSDGESGTATMDVGIKSGNTDAFLDAADVSTATGNIDIPAGAVPSGHYGGLQWGRGFLTAEIFKN